MFEKYFEQTERFFRPMNEIWSLQAQAAESLSKTNSHLLTEVWQDGWNFAQSLASQKGLDDAFKLQHQYWDAVTQQLQHAADENQNLLAEMNQKIADVIQEPDREGKRVTVAAAAGVAKNQGKSQSPSNAQTAAGTAKKHAPSSESSPAKNEVKKSVSGDGSAKRGTADKAHAGSPGKNASNVGKKNGEHSAKGTGSSAKAADGASAKSAPEAKAQEGSKASTQGAAKKSQHGSESASKANSH